MSELKKKMSESSRKHSLEQKSANHALQSSREIPVHEDPKGRPNKWTGHFFPWLSSSLQWRSYTFTTF